MTLWLILSHQRTFCNVALLLGVDICHPGHMSCCMAV